MLGGRSAEDELPLTRHMPDSDPANPDEAAREERDRLVAMLRRAADDIVPVERVSEALA